MKRAFLRATAPAAVLILILLAAGCGKKESADPSLGAVVARVNGESIHESEAAREVQSLLAMMGPAGANAQSDPTALQQIRQQAINNLIDRRLLLDRAKTEGIVPGDEEVTAELEKVKATFPDPAAFQARLAQVHMTEDEVKREIGMNLCLTRLREKVSAGLPAATNEDAVKYYAEHPDEFQSPEEIRASHILIRSSAADSAAVRAEARKKAEAVLAEVRGGRDFAEAAKEHSQDPGTAPNGGDVGYFSRGGGMPPALEAAAFTLDAGKSSDIIESPYGFHILKVTEKRPARTIPIEEVQEKIVQFLDQNKGNRAIQSVIEESRTKAKIERIEPEASKG